MNRYPSSTPQRAIRRTAIALFILSSVLLSQKPSVSVQIASGGNTVLLGDTVRFQVWVNTDGLTLTGYEFYLTVDPEIFEPLYTTELQEDTIAILRPFIPSNLLLPPPAGPHINDTDGDVWSDPFIDLNNNALFQMDYAHQTAPLTPGNPRQSFSGAGVAAYFDMVVHRFPANPTRSSTIWLDTQYARPGGRQCKYNIADNSPAIGFQILNPLTVTVLGLAIFPDLPDTVLAPGEDLRLSLWDHFSAGPYDSSTVSWNLAPNFIPSGASAVPIDLENPYRDSVIVTTGFTTQGVIDLDVTLSPNDGLVADWTDNWLIIVDQLPLIGPSVPAILMFNEDDSVGVAGSDLYSDGDDTPAEMTLTVDPDTLIRVNYDTGADIVYFGADPDWYGSGAWRLTITDMLGQSIDTLINFVVNPVNDAPIVNLDNFAGVLRDTLIMHRSTPDTVDLSAFTNDVDDLTLVWSTDDPSPANLTVGTPSAGGVLIMTVPDTAIFADYLLIITATDTSSATGSDTLVVSIRTWSPEIIEPLSEIFVVAGGPETVSLTGLVIDNDTPDANLTWSFEVRDFLLDTIDTQVLWTYDNTAQEVTITAPTGYDTQNRLNFFVVDDSNNRDTASARLGIFSTLRPAVFTFPLDTLIWNTTTDLLDLDDFVLDPIYSPNQLDTIVWTYFGGTRLASVFIDPSTHVVTITTDPNFFGWDTVSFIATNPENLSDTSAQVLRILPDVDLPPVWLTLGDFEVVFDDTTDLFRLTERVIDDFTLVDSLSFSWVINPDPLKPVNLIVDSTTWDIKVTDQTGTNYTTWLYFTATDEQNQTAISDTVFIAVKDSYSPVWSNLPIVRMETSSQAQDSLRQYLSDRDTPFSGLTVTVTPADSRITVNYNPVTSIVTYISKSIQTETLVTYIASDSEGNVSAAVARIIVKEPFDPIPPEGVVSYYFHPVHDKRIEYVVVADSTTVNFTNTYVLNSRERTLTFTQTDTLPPTYTWIARDKFSVAGNYKLFAEVNDLRNNVNRMSLDLTIAFSKAIGGQLVSPDGKLSLSYPPLPIPEGNLIILSQTFAAGGQAGGLVSLSKGAPLRTYDIDTNLPEEILMTVHYRLPGDDPYHAFYDLTDGTQQRLETYLTDDGRFEAYLPTGRTVAFAKSAVRASALPSAGQLWTHPNPFNSTLQVRFMLRVPGTAGIAIYNLLGQLVFRTPRSEYAPGIHSIAWHGNDLHGRTVPSGIYFVRLTTSRGTPQLQKVTLLK